MIRPKLRKAIDNPAKAYEHLSKIPFRVIDEFANYGVNVFEKDWQLLIILDACRYDLFTEFCPRHSVHDLLDSTDPVYSIASQTVDWLERTFEQADDSSVSQTAFIAGNPWIEEVETGGLDIEPVWQYAIHPETHVTLPEVVTNEAIRKFRTTNKSRYIVHYVQPHAPFLHCIGKYDSAGDEPGKSMNVWNGLRDGKFDKNEVWEDYGKNLMLALDHVETLIRNFDGKIVITADHGNAMGEFGLYGHPGRQAAPSIRRVPWSVARGLGINDYELKAKEEVTTEGDIRDPDSKLQQHLRDLGYRV